MNFFGNDLFDIQTVLPIERNNC